MNFLPLFLFYVFALAVGTLLAIIIAEKL